MSMTKLEKLTTFGRQVTANCGLTPEQVAAAFGRTHEVVVCESRRDGCMTTETKAKIIAKRREGMRIAQIAAELGLTEGSCKAVLRRSGHVKPWKKKA